MMMMTDDVTDHDVVDDAVVR